MYKRPVRLQKKENNSKDAVEYILCWFLTAGYGAFP